MVMVMVMVMVLPMVLVEIDDGAGGDFGDPDVHGLGRQRTVLHSRPTWSSAKRRQKSAQGSQSS